MSDEQALYNVLSVNAEAMAWKGPLWSAVNDYARVVGGDPDRHSVGVGGSRVRAVNRVEAAVEVAIRAAFAAGKAAADSGDAPAVALPDPEQCSCRACDRLANPEIPDFCDPCYDAGCTWVSVLCR